MNDLGSLRLTPSQANPNQDVLRDDADQDRAATFGQLLDRLDERVSAMAIAAPPPPGLTPAPNCLRYYVFPGIILTLDADVTRGGLAKQPGTYGIIELAGASESPEKLAHEFGHNLGLKHVNSDLFPSNLMTGDASGTDLVDERELPDLTAQRQTELGGVSQAVKAHQTVDRLEEAGRLSVEEAPPILLPEDMAVGSVLLYFFGVRSRLEWILADLSHYASATSEVERQRWLESLRARESSLAAQEARDIENLLGDAKWVDGVSEMIEEEQTRIAELKRQVQERKRELGLE